MGASTTTVQGDTFAADPSQVGVLFMLGPSETFTQFDVDAVRRFVTAGGTAVPPTHAGIVRGAGPGKVDPPPPRAPRPRPYPGRGGPLPQPAPPPLPLPPRVPRFLRPR